MAQATSSSTTLTEGKHDDPRNQSNLKSDADVPIDPSIAASSPTYPPPYSPYQPQGHDMSQYQGHPPQMYARPDWSHGYPQHQHGMPGPYNSPATTVGSASPAAIAGPRPGQVRSSWLWRMMPEDVVLVISTSRRPYRDTSTPRASMRLASQSR